MFSTNNLRQLRKSLDSFPIPMFAAQRPTRADAFRMLCINRAHEDESGLASIDIEGLRPLDILPPDEAEAVESRYALCIRLKEVIQYDEVLHIKGLPTSWRTILHPVRMRGGLSRVIGTSFVLDHFHGEPVAMGDVSAAMAETEDRFGTVSYLLRPNGPPPERRVIQAHLSFKTPPARALSQSVMGQVANESLRQDQNQNA